MSRNTGDIGREAEAAAERFLRRRGLRAVTRNYRTPGGEIDLIMRDGVELVFVEVRRRADPRFGRAAETVGTRKQHRLATAARQYLQRHGEQPCRFDVIAIDAGNDIQWIPDAFRVG